MGDKRTFVWSYFELLSSGRVAADQLPMAFTLRAAYEVGDTVVLEAESVATMPDGSAYRNWYCYVVTTFGDCILHVRVYPDTNVVVNLRAKMPTMREAFDRRG